MKIKVLFISLLILLNVFQYFYFKYQIKETAVLNKNENKLFEIEERCRNNLALSINNNDSLLYARSRGDCIMYGNLQEMFYFSVIMYMEHDNLNALDDMYTILNDRNDIFNGFKLSTFKKYLLAKAYERTGQCANVRLIRNDKGTINPSSHYLELLKESK